MNVSQFMDPSPVKVKSGDKVREAIRIFLNLQKRVIPVVESGVLVGKITPKDILTRMLPDVEEFIDNFAGASRGEYATGKLKDLLDKPVSEVMQRRVRTVTSDMPLMRALSVMMAYDIGNIPVVDGKKRLIGMLTQADVFRAFAGEEMPYDTAGEFRDWVGHYYDLIVDWPQRLTPEVADLTRLLKKNGRQAVVDIGTATGEHVIGLAKNGIYAIGIDPSKAMIRIAQAKRDKLPSAVKKNAYFIHARHNELKDKLPAPVDSALFMGSTLFFLTRNWQQLLKQTDALFRSHGTVVIQLTNIKRLMKDKHGLHRFSIVHSKNGDRGRYVFTEFLTQEKDRQTFTFTESILRDSGKRWVSEGVDTNSVVPVSPTVISSYLKKLGYQVSLYESDYSKSLFQCRYKKNTHDWVTIVANR